MPKELFSASEPPMDWNTRSMGAPREMASMEVVTCVSTQLCVGMSSFRDQAVEHAQHVDEGR